MLVHNVLTPRPQPTLSKGSYEIEFGITFVAIRPFRTYFVTTNTTKLLFIVNFFWPFFYTSQQILRLASGTL